MSLTIDSLALERASKKHDADRDKFHAQFLKLHPDRKRCCLCSHPLKKVRMTLTTSMTITLKSRMVMPIVTDTAKGTRGYTREFQKELHKGIMQAIVNTIEHARDDNDFDQDALDAEDLNLDPTEFGLKEPLEISDFADIRLVYRSGNKTWLGDVMTTKAERNQ